MLKYASFLLMLLSLPFGVLQGQNKAFSMYKAVEAYEIRPGIILMPRYSHDGAVCEIGIERKHFSPERIIMESQIARDEIEKIFEEIVPPKQRGPKSTSLLERGGVIVEGNMAVTREGYDNVTLRIYSEFLPDTDPKRGSVQDVAATITWNHRSCD